MRRAYSYYGTVKTRPARAAPPTIRGSAKDIVSDLARKTRYLDPALAARWSDFVGEELAKICRPGRMTGGGNRSGLGRTVEIIVPNGAAAARIQMETELIKTRLNQHLGPNSVARITLRQIASNANPKAKQRSTQGPLSPRKPSLFFDFE